MKYGYVRAYDNSSINSFSFVKSSNNPNLVLTGGGNDYEIKLFRLESPKEDQTEVCKDGPMRVFPKIHSNSINALDCAQAGYVFVSSSNDQIVVVDMVTQKKLYSVSNLPMKKAQDDDESLSLTQSSHARDEVLDCKFLTDDLVASCGVNHHLNMFDLRQSRKAPVFSVNMGDDNLNSLGFNTVSDGQDYTITQVSVGSSNGNLYSIDIRKQQLITDPFEDFGSIVDVYREGSNRSVLTFDNGEVVLFNIENSTTESHFNIGKKLNYKMNAEIIKSYVLRGTDEGTVELNRLNGDVFEKMEIFSQLAPTDSAGRILNIVRYQDELNRVVSTSGNGIIHIWDDIPI
ncbi:WD40-repeat-containing domain protein [Scheffersomyces xylosifermentans]|uniref:WD40-repeat-containing domain protein n=1 Tax=Scheffersomyces xylosifermentans TaxID=1304137 RepID=UPI00315E01B7